MVRETRRFFCVHQGKSRDYMSVKSSDEVTPGYVTVILGMKSSDDPLRADSVRLALRAVRARSSDSSLYVIHDASISSLYPYSRDLSLFSK